MSPKIPNDAINALRDECTAAWREGADFPTIWQEILLKHRLVAGRPVQAQMDNETALKVLLVGGQWLVFGPKGFSIR